MRPRLCISDRGIGFAGVAAIFVMAVRPKHPPLWRTKFVGLTAFRFWVSTPRCSGRRAAFNRLFPGLSAGLRWEKPW